VNIYLSSKVVCFLFYFVSFCHAELSWTMAFHATLLVSLESSWWVGVHQLGFRLFGATMWTLLMIEPFYQTKQNRNWKVYWYLGVFLVLSESPWKFIFNRVYFKIFRAKVWKILSFEWILLLEIQTTCKNWVRKEESVEPLMCSYLGHWHRRH